MSPCTISHPQTFTDWPQVGTNGQPLDIIIELTAAWIFLNSFLLVPSGTNWFAFSTRIGVLFEGESSATHCNGSREDSRR